VVNCQTEVTRMEVVTPSLGSGKPQHFKVLCFNGNYPKQFSKGANNNTKKKRYCSEVYYYETALTRFSKWFYGLTRPHFSASVEYFINFNWKLRWDVQRRSSR